MADYSINPVVAYICECGRKWTFARKNTMGKRSLKCECGRTVVIDEGIIYTSTKEQAKRA